MSGNTNFISNFFSKNKLEIGLATVSSVMIHHMPNWLLATTTFIGTGYILAKKQSAQNKVLQSVVSAFSQCFKKGERLLEEDNIDNLSVIDALGEAWDASSKAISSVTVGNTKQIAIAGTVSAVATMVLPRSYVTAASFAYSAQSLILNRTENRARLKNYLQWSANRTEMLASQLEAIDNGGVTSWFRKKSK